MLNADYAGSSCFCPQLQVADTKSIDQRTSIFTAECIALNDALDIVLKNPGNNFLIFSDFRSALQSLETISLKIRNNPLILEIKKVQYDIRIRTNHSRILLDIGPY